MTSPSLFAGSLVSALLISTAAQALTPEEVWQDWKELSAAAGQQLTVAGEARMGDTLVVTGLNLSVTEPEAAASATIPEVRFRDTGDGRVEVTMSPSYPMSMQFPNADGEPVVINLDISQGNLKMFAAGTPENSTYDFTADSMAVATTGVTEAGQAVPMKFSVTMNGMTGNYVLARQQAGMVDVDSSFSVGSTGFIFSFADPDNQGNSVQAEGTLAQLAAVTSGTFGGAAASPELKDALAAGLALSLSMTYGATNFTMAVAEDGSNTSVRGQAASGSFGAEMDKTRLGYRAGGTGVEMAMSGDEIPFPEVVLRYAEAGFAFLLPIAKGDAPQDFGLSFKLADLTVSDEIWAMIDPMGNLPRDPATLVLETRGKTTMLVDLMDEESMAAAEMPALLNALDIPALQLKVAGAELTGNGALTFDDNDWQTFGGVPAPTGTVTLNLTGGNGLLDKLVAMGLVPDDQAMSVRMMMGMFARPGTGPDSLTSTIEFKDGGLFANGMRLQ